ncbi:MAG: response regulator, partial [Acutalibacteraceae bacterium]
MYKVFVVDDEDWIRQRLIETVDWASIGAEVAGEASDGQSALEKIRELKPDIVLTDICMPEDDGLSLIEKINALSISVKIIIISGYDYFEYTKSAIKLGAFSYILKPVDDGELLKTAAEAIKELEKSRKKEDILRRLEEQVKEQLPFQREKFYDNLLHGYLKNSRWAYDEMELLGIKNKGCGHICLAIEPDRKFSDDTGPAEVHRFKYLVANIAEDFLKKIGEYEILFSRSDEVVCAVSAELTDGMTEERFKKRVTAAAFGIANMVRRLLDGTVTIGIGNPVDDLIKLNHSFEEAETALSYRNFLGENGIYNVEAADKYVQPVTCDSYDIESLCQRVRDADAQGALSCLDKILD